MNKRANDTRGLETPHIWQTKDSIRQFPRSHLTPNYKSGIYQTNEFGLRKHDTSGNKTLLTVGCSHTFGTGLQTKETWAEQLANKLGYKLINVGTPGASVGVCCTNAVWALDLYKVDMVVWYCSTPDRVEYFRNDDSIGIIYPTGDFDRDTDPSVLTKWRKLYFAGMNDTQYITALQNLRSVFSLIKSKNIPNIFNYWGWHEKESDLVSLCDEYDTLYHDDKNDRYIPDIDRATDNEHFGPLSQKAFAEKTYNLIQNRLTYT